MSAVTVQSGGTLAPGQSQSFQLTVAIDPGLTGLLSNTATVDPPNGVTDPNPGNNSATDTNTLTPQADLTIAKSDGKASVVPGSRRPASWPPIAPSRPPMYAAERRRWTAGRNRARRRSTGDSMM